MKQHLVKYIPDAERDELEFLAEITQYVDESKLTSFFMIYRSRRRKADSVLLLTILGFVVIAGVQRFYLNQYLMGFLYLFTGGFCLVGTIIDLINHKEMTLQYNEEIALDLVDEMKLL